MKRDLTMCIQIPSDRETDFRLFTVTHGGAIADVSRWFPVTEKLPPEGIDVLVTVEYKSVTNSNRICYCVESGSYYQDEWDVTIIKHMYPGADPKVTAWKPMPEPYYGEGES